MNSNRHLPNESSGRRWHLLVIGYGNELRGDDAAGPLVARRIAGLQLGRIKVVATPVLVPEMAMDMSKAERVLFVDASVRCGTGRVRLSPVAGRRFRPVFSGGCSPEMLAGLCETLCGCRPKSWLLEIPAVQFDLGFSVSETTAKGVEKAAALVWRWIVARNSLSGSPTF